MATMTERTKLSLDEYVAQQREQFMNREIARVSPAAMEAVVQVFSRWPVEQINVAAIVALMRLLPFDSAKVIATTLLRAHIKIGSSREFMAWLREHNREIMAMRYEQFRR